MAERNNKWMAAKRKADPEFAERQRAAKRKWYKENSAMYKFDVREWRNKNRHKVTAYTRKWRYGISQEQFDAILASQGKRCKLCRRDDPGKCWTVDHDHACCGNIKTCGACIRGILCSQCNLMLGAAKDNQKILAAAIEYLKEFEATQVPSECNTTTRLHMVANGD